MHPGSWRGRGGERRTPLAERPSASLTASTDSVYLTVGRRQPLAKGEPPDGGADDSPYDVVDPIIKIMSTQGSTASFYCLPHRGVS